MRASVSDEGSGTDCDTMQLVIAFVSSVTAALSAIARSIQDGRAGVQGNALVRENMSLERSGRTQCRGTSNLPEHVAACHRRIGISP